VAGGLVATFSDRVTALTGSVTNSTELGTWLSDGVVDIIRKLSLIDKSMLYRFASVATVGTGGLSLGTTKYGEVLNGYNGTAECHEIDADMRFRAARSDSLHRATSQHPVMYRLNGSIFILPSSATTYVSIVSPQTVAATDSTISNFPEELDYLVVIYAAIQNLQGLISGLTLPDYVNLPVPPVLDLGSALSISTLSLSSVAPVLEDIDITAGAIDDFGSAPTFTPPTLTMASVETLNSLDLPVPPSIDVSVDKTLTAAVEATGIVLPTISLPSTPTITEADISSISQPIPPADPSFTTPTITLADAPTYVGPTKAIDISTALSTVTTYIGTDEDLDKSTEKLKQIAETVQNFAADVNNSLNEFNEQNVEYQGVLQKEIEEAKLVGTKEQTEYAALIQKYQAEVQMYVAEINAAVQQFANNQVQYRISIWTTQSQLAINEYQAIAGATIQKYAQEIASKSNLTEAEVAIFGAEMQRKANLNKLNLESYGTEVNAVVQKWNLEELQGKQAKWIAQRSSEISKFQLDIQNAVQEFNALNVEYQAAIQKNIEEARNSLTSESEEIKDKLQEFAGKINIYQTEINAEIEEYRQTVDSEKTNWVTNRNNLINEYASDIQLYAQQIGGEINNFTAKLGKQNQQFGWWVDQYKRLKEQYDGAFVTLKENRNA
jgi:hypothetical protein